MSSAVYFFATEEDTEALTIFAESLGLQVVPIRLTGDAIARARTNPNDHPFCFLTASALVELHAYGDPPRLSPAIDPLIEFLRSRRVGELVVAGRLYWSDDDDQLAKQTKPFFEKLKRWIKANWSRRSGDGYFLGAFAERAASEGAIRLTYVDPGASVETRAGGPGSGAN